MQGWKPVIFNGVDLSELAGVTITEINHHKRPIRSMVRRKLARADGSKLVQGEYGDRMITMAGVVTGTSRANYEANRDTLFRYLNELEATLRLSQAGANRDYVCSVDDIDFTEKPTGGFAPFVIKFIVGNPPFGVDATSSTVMAAKTVTGSSGTHGFTPFGGSADWLPVFTVTMSALSGGTGKYVRITNPATGKYIQLTRNWSALDVLVVDCEAKTCRVNGALMDFQGVFPSFGPDDGSVTYSDTLTTRSITIAITGKRRYL